MIWKCVSVSYGIPSFQVTTKTNSIRNDNKEICAFLTRSVGTEKCMSFYSLKSIMKILCGAALGKKMAFVTLDNVKGVRKQLKERVSPWERVDTEF